MVVLDAKILFGALRIADTWVSTATLLTAVPGWYGVGFAAVADAVTFESEWLRPAAA